MFVELLYLIVYHVEDVAQVVIQLPQLILVWCHARFLRTLKRRAVSRDHVGCIELACLCALTVHGTHLKLSCEREQQVIVIRLAKDVEGNWCDVAVCRVRGVPVYTALKARCLHVARRVELLIWLRCTNASGPYALVAHDASNIEHVLVERLQLVVAQHHLPAHGVDEVLQLRVRCWDTQFV